MVKTSSMYVLTYFKL